MRRVMLSGAVVAAVAVMAAPGGVSGEHEWSEPLNLGEAINTEFDEAGPALSRSGRVLYFQTNRPVLGGNCDIWVAQRESEEQEWGTPEPLTAVNTPGCENSVSVSRDEHHMFFTRPPGDIWVSYRRDVRDPFGWETPVRLGSTINTDPYSESTARLFASARHGVLQLYFFSNRPGGPGGADLYVADLLGGAPRVITELSSPDIDGGPVLSRDGLEVFFHSTRPGLGVRDLWIARRDSIFDPWSTPENIVAVNSSHDDWFPALSADDDELYFASARPGGRGANDLYVTRRRRTGQD